MATKKKKRSRRRKQRARILLCLVLGGVAAALLITYLSIASYYGKHYFPKTMISDLDCSNKTPEYIEEKLLDEAGSYLLTIYDRTGEKNNILGVDIQYRYLSTGEEEDILEHQENFKWPAHMSDEKDYDLHHSAVYDEEALRRVVERFPFMNPENMEPPTDAEVQLSTTGYELVEETQGNTVIPEQVLSEIADAIQGQKNELTLSDDCYLKPSITTESPEITNLTTQFDNFTNSTVTYQIEGVEESISGDTLTSLLSMTEDGTVYVDEEKVSDYVQALAYKYNTYGDEREFKTALGDTITIGGGDYGWVIDKPGETAQLMADLNGGVPVTREPVYEQRALVSGFQDIGSTYVEIDYTNQHLYYFKEGTLVTDTDCVTGNISRHNGSPDGVFKIVYKKSPAVLVGEDYASDVDFFMPFAYNVGIHDASWRSSFGGNIYLTSGSHGCINVPRSAAEKLYEVLEVGTPVVAYYRNPVVLTAENARISNAYSYHTDAEPTETDQAAQAQAAQAAADAQAAQAAQAAADQAAAEAAAAQAAAEAQAAQAAAEAAWLAEHGG